MISLSSIRDKLLTIFGDIKIYPTPMGILYDPGSYLIKGNEVRTLLTKVQTGDILVRGFLRYLDGYFIPGYMSHVGLYLGEVPRLDLMPLSPQSDVDPFYKEGKQMVIHAMAEGVFMEDILSFSRCDYLIVLRSPKNIKLDLSKIYSTAIQNLGKPYDFGFNFVAHDSLSCTEFVMDCLGLHSSSLDVLLKSQKLFFITKEVLIPDDFITDKFVIIWMNNSVDKEKIFEIRKNNREFAKSWRHPNK